MNIKTAAQVIRDDVTMDRILDMYGYRTKHGFMCCPFHGEKEPSLKVYSGNGGWHCFGCERGGSVIDFVMQHEQCSFQTAVRAIDEALHLNLLDHHEMPDVSRSKQRVQDALDDFCDAIYAYCDALIQKIEGDQKTKLDMVMILEEVRAKDVQQVSADDWTTILKWKEEDQFDEYRKDKITEFKEEVAAWRRKARNQK